MLPFFLIVVVFLLVVYRFLYSIPAPKHCAEGLENYKISKGDTCWQIATDKQITVDELTTYNAGLDCDHLAIGSRLCVPHHTTTPVGGDKPRT